MLAVITILVVIAILIIVICTWLWVINRRGRERASLIAVIDIFPSGQPLVEFAPPDSSDDLKLMKLALLYAAKIKWVLKDEVTDVNDVYEEGMRAASADSENTEIDARISKLIEPIFESGEFALATNEGERFTVRLVEGNGTFVHNDIPFRGLAANIPLSVLLLARAVAVRLDQENKVVFDAAFSNLIAAMFDGRTLELLALNQLGLDALNIAREAYTKP